MADMENKNESSFTPREVELIRELVKARLESNQKLEYERFDGYDIPPRAQFPMLKKPTLTIKNGKFCCNMAAIRLFEGVKYILPMVNSRKQRLAIVPCAEEESASVEWARQRKKDGVWCNKYITAPDFTENLFKLMNWERDCTYKIHGELKDSERGLILVFDLSEAIFLAPKKEEYVDSVTGEVRKRQVKYYPDFYQNRIGRSYNEYARERQTGRFENTETYDDPEQFMIQAEPTLSGQTQTSIERVPTESTIRYERTWGDEHTNEGTQAKNIYAR